MAGRYSILFEDEGPELEPHAPPYFADLNLDRVVAAITTGREEYDLVPLFHTRLKSVAAIAYRHAVMRDLERPEVRSCVDEFARRMRAMRGHLARAGNARNRYERKTWFLDAARAYGEAVTHLAADLTGLELGSRGLRAFAGHLTEYAASEAFTTLVADAESVKDGLAGVTYSVNINGNRVRVGRYESETDFSAAVTETFEKFRQGEVKSRRTPSPSTPMLDPVEARILDLVARLHLAVFAASDDFCERHRDHVDVAVATFDREVQFYVACLEHVERLGRAGLALCYPEIGEDEEIHAREAFDVALADKLLPEGAPVVGNDLHLAGAERIIVVSGPNQGGKTTFARMVGQLHHLAAIGCPVPGAEARLHLCDQIFTHFAREEDLTNLRGKLEDDLVRVHEMLEQATASSLVIMNETFTSTTLRDARVLGRAVLERMIEQDLLCVYVTFVDELASLGEATVSMVSTVVPDDPATRTYKVVRRPADGLAYAAAIAERHGVTYARVKERIAR